MARTGAERRQHKRLDLACPITLGDGRSEAPSKTKTLNLSDGGAFMSVPPEEAPPLGTELGLRLSVPRSTPNTYMLEDFLCRGRVVRHQPLPNERALGVAVRFASPLQLALEV